MEQKHNKTVQGCDITPPSRKVRPRTVEQQRGGGTGGNQGGGSGGGGTPGRGPTDRDQGGDEGGRSQGRDRRDPEQEAHRWTQATAMMMAHGGARGRSHGGVIAADSRGPTNGGGAGGGGARDGEPMSQGDAEDPGG